MGLKERVIAKKYERELDALMGADPNLISTIMNVAAEGVKTGGEYWASEEKKKAEAAATKDQREAQAAATEARKKATMAAAEAIGDPKKKKWAEELDLAAKVAEAKAAYYKAPSPEAKKDVEKAEKKVEAVQKGGLMQYVTPMNVGIGLVGLVGLGLGVRWMRSK